MDIIIKVSIAAVTVAAVGLLIKSVRPELTVPVSVAAIVVTAIAILPEITQAMELTRSFTDNAHIETVLKIMGIAYITHFTSDICRGAGENALAGGVELTGKLTVMLLSLPLATRLLNMIETLV